jgi:hypothetical protein
VTLLLLAALLGADPAAELLEADYVLPRGLADPDVLNELRSRPVDLNRADLVELMRIQSLSPELASRILTVRDSVGGLRSPSDLRRLGLLDSLELEKLTPFVRVGSAPSKGSLQIVMRVSSESLGHIARRHAAQAQRIQAAAGRFGLVVLAARDAGESELCDLLAGGVAFRNVRTSVLFGNFELHAGQGLVFGRPHFQLGIPDATAWAAEPATLPRGFAENTLLQGGSLTQRIGPLRTGVFVSRQRLDAQPLSDSCVRGIDYSGRHDDSVSRAGQRLLGEDFAGTRMEFCGSRLGAGVSGFTNRYSRRISPSGAGFRGQGLSVLGADAIWQPSEYRLGLELAQTIGHGWAGALDLRGRWAGLEMRFGFVHYERDFYSPHSRARGLARTRSEQQVRFRLTRRIREWQFTGSGTTAQNTDVDSMPARIELLVRRCRAPLDLSLRWKQSFCDVVSTTGGLRLDIEWSPVPGLGLLLHAEDRFGFDNPGRRGAAVAAGVSYRANRLELGVRAIAFDVDDADVRVYAWESGPSGNNRAFAGRGERLRLVGSLGPVRGLRLQTALGLTVSGPVNLDAAVGLSFVLGA